MKPITLTQTKKQQVILHSDIYGDTPNYKAVQIGNRTYFIDIIDATSVLTGEIVRIPKAYRQKVKEPIANIAYVVQEVSSVPLTSRLTEQLIQDSKSKHIELLITKGKSLDKDLEELTEELPQ